MNGSIYKRKDGYFYGRVSCNGVKKQFYGKSKRDVQNKIDEFVGYAKYNNLTTNNSILFSEYYYNYIMTYKYGFVKNSSFDRMESILNSHIKGSVIDVPMYQLDDIVVQQFLNSKRNFSNSVIRNIYNLVRLILAYAYKKKDINVDIAGLIKIPKSVKGDVSRNIYTDGDVDMFQDAMSTSPDDDLFPYILSFIVILNTGMRSGEMLALVWNDIDFTSNVIHVRHSVSRMRARDGPGYIHVVADVKTRQSARDIPMNNIARKCIDMLHDISDCEYVLSYHSDFVKLNRYQRLFKRVCSALNVPNYGIHALRHTFASRLIRRGIPPKVVSNLLGHSSVTFTMDRYVHVYDEDMTDAVRLLAGDAFVVPDDN